MKATGIVVEYNPFHNGHALHLSKTRELTDADIVIAVMSGQFLQRGEPALLPKWTRAKMALMAGVDIVLELPYQFATQHAEIFARGSISSLAAIGCDSICFGSENGDIQAFHDTIHFLEQNKEEYSHHIKKFIANGVSYPTALSLAYKTVCPTNNNIDLSKPNNILGFHYIKAITDLKLPLQPMTITRSNDYHAEHFSSETIASATSIRKSLFADGGSIDSIQPYVPATTLKLIREYKDEFLELHEWENYWPYLQYKILQSTPQELKKIYEVEEGLENRLIRFAQSSHSFYDFMTNLKTKRYTWTRLQRLCVHILTNTTVEEMQQRMEQVTYLRLLGMNESGRQYLNKWKANAPIPLVSKLSAYTNSQIDLDLRASCIYALGVNNHKRQVLLNMEYNQPPIYLQK